MYQYSLNWYLNLFNRAIDSAEESKKVQQRTKNIVNTFLYSLYRNVCRSLFEKHKLLFSFLLCLKVLQGRNQIDAIELRFLLTGGALLDAKIPPNPCSSNSTNDNWLTDDVWTQLVALSRMNGFQGLIDHVSKNLIDWKAYFFNNEAYTSAPPGIGVWKDNLTMLQKMLVLRCIRPDQTIRAIQAFVSENLDPQFIEPPGFDLAAAFTDSDQCTPLIFVLSAGVDPSKDVLKLAEVSGNINVVSISLGQGQGPIAEQAIREVIKI